MISLDEARALLLDAVAPLAAENIALADAAGRILAAGIVASFDQPATAACCVRWPRRMR